MDADAWANAQATKGLGKKANETTGLSQQFAPNPTIPIRLIRRRTFVRSVGSGFCTHENSQYAGSKRVRPFRRAASRSSPFRLATKNRRRNGRQHRHLFLPVDRRRVFENDQNDDGTLCSIRYADPIPANLTISGEQGRVSR